MDRQVEKLLKKKMDLSFEVYEEKKHFTEIDDVQDMIDKCTENYRLFKKAGKLREAKVLKAKIQETKYAKEHLIKIMNLDFSRPTQKMKDLAVKSGINLTDPLVINEFKKIQQKNLEDIRNLKAGKKI